MKIVWSKDIRSLPKIVVRGVRDFEKEPVDTVKHLLAEVFESGEKIAEVHLVITRDEDEFFD